MNLLVVDDEYYAVKGITQGIDWSDLSIAHIYEAMDARMAKQILTEQHIDILISDIEMPGENGLSLLDWACAHSPETKTIFLTGHANFHYAQKAVQLGSFDYVLKPIDHDDLKIIVAKAIVQIRAEKEFLSFHETYKIYSELWHQQLPALVERFWQDLLSHRIDYSPERLETYFRQIYLPLKPDSHVTPILISIEQWRLVLDTHDEDIMEYAIRKAASEVILQDDLGVVFEDYKGNHLAIVYPTDESAIRLEELQGRCRQFIQACDQYFHCFVSCYIGTPEPLSTLERAVQSLLSKERNNTEQTNSVILDRGQESVRNGCRQMLYQLPPFSDWSAFYETGKKEELLGRIEEYFHHMQQCEIGPEFLEAFYYGVLHMVYSTHHRKGLSVRSLKGVKQPDDANALRSLQHLKSWACLLIESGIELLAANHRNVSALTGKALAYIAEHLHEEGLSREQIAASVYLNPAYLSRLFKRETGLSLTDYIVSQRIDTAKALLIEGASKISNIAEATGYSHLSYFAKSFKRMVGMTPQEFRKQFHATKE